MWLFSQTGFVSIVNHREQKNNMLVRGRIRQDVVSFRDLAKNSNYVSYTPENDYAYRVMMTRKEVQKAIKSTIEKIRYTNFKEAVHDGTSRDPAYMRVWSTLLEYLQLQPNNLKEWDKDPYSDPYSDDSNLTFPPEWDKQTTDNRKENPWTKE